MQSLIRPMLAQPAQPFDSPQHLFEVKWDGIRSLAAVEHGRLRLWGRRPVEHTDRYPELEALRTLPSGTVLDGELVRLRDGKADLGAILGRHQLTSSRKIRWASQHCPVVYVVFDVLSQCGRSLMDRPLAERREVLAEILGRLQLPPVVLSAGVVGAGQAFFQQVIAQGHEGVMAKHLAGRYVPGRRSASWKKIKPPWRSRAAGSSVSESVSAAAPPQ